MNEGLRYCVAAGVAFAFAMAIAGLTRRAVTALDISEGFYAAGILIACVGGYAISRTLLHGGGNGDV